MDKRLEHGVARDADMRSGDQGGQEEGAPVLKEGLQLLLLRPGKDGKSGEGVPLAAADGRGQAPNTSAPGAEFGDFLLGEF